ncbi:sugar transferase [Parabacteroides sp. OttesenSCG-928-G07]|nr:sugar transferase [Parabacteroides sp. OttesenSCG-928-G21]MDL2278077.1 sugar transferase [Parabacteroides sp. OttesenSCG-928-G07]
MLLKRGFDITVSLIGLLILLPVLLFISILIKAVMPGPILFKQIRVGKNGKLFTMYKFRTMIINHSGSSVSVKGESRITPLGSILRKLKLDELPELWNILIGDMSFIGPRPDVPGYADRLNKDDQIILSVRPGLTGLATLKYITEEEILAQQKNPQHYNDNVIYPDKVRINKRYINEWSFWLDMQIFFWTITGSKLPDKYR